MQRSNNYYLKQIAKSTMKPSEHFSFNPTTKEITATDISNRYIVVYRDIVRNAIDTNNPTYTIPYYTEGTIYIYLVTDETKLARIWGKYANSFSQWKKVTTDLFVYETQFGE